MRYSTLNEDFIDNIESDDISISSDVNQETNFLSGGFCIHMHIEREYSKSEIEKIRRHIIRCLRTNRFISVYSEPFYEYNNEYTECINNYASFMSFSIKQRFRNTRHIAEFLYSLINGYRDYFKPCYIYIVGPNPDILEARLKRVEDYMELLDDPQRFRDSGTAYDSRNVFDELMKVTYTFLSGLKYADDLIDYFKIRYRLIDSLFDKDLQSRNKPIKIRKCISELKGRKFNLQNPKDPNLVTSEYISCLQYFSSSMNYNEMTVMGGSFSKIIENYDGKEIKDIQIHIKLQKSEIILKAVLWCGAGYLVDPHYPSMTCITITKQLFNGFSGHHTYVRIFFDQLSRLIDKGLSQEFWWEFRDAVDAMPVRGSGDYTVGEFFETWKRTGIRP